MKNCSTTNQRGLPREAKPFTRELTLPNLRRTIAFHHGKGKTACRLVASLRAIICPLFPQVFAVDFPNERREQRRCVPRGLVIVHDGKRLTFCHAGGLHKLCASPKNFLGLCRESQKISEESNDVDGKDEHEHSAKNAANILNNSSALLNGCTLQCGNAERQCDERRSDNDKQNETQIYNQLSRRISPVERMSICSGVHQPGNSLEFNHDNENPRPSKAGRYEQDAGQHFRLARAVHAGVDP